MLNQFSIVHRLAAFCCLWLLCVPAQASRGVEKVTEVEGITEYRLDNGLTVLLFPDPTKETVTVNVTYKVGSRHENYGETGMAHLLEHLLFKGSEKHENIPEELSAHGAKPNGTTWIDRTNYYETFSATDENIDWALSLESDRMVNSFIAEQDLESEMTVVRNEFERSASNPFSVLMQRMSTAAYMWHNNGKPTIGARSDIENVDIERLQAFYEKYYQPDNAVLTIAGQFDEKAMLKRVRNTFGKLKKPERKLEEHYTQEPPQDGEKMVTVRRVGDIKWYAAMYHIPAGSHPDFAAIDVLMQILGDTPRGRLHKDVVQSGKAVRSFAFPFQLKEPGVALLGTQVEKDGDLDQARDAFLRVVEGVADQPITEDEVTLGKTKLLKEFDQAFNSSERIAVMLSEYIGMGDWRLLFLTRDRIEQVTKEDVQRVAEAYFLRNNRTAGRFIPTEEPQRVRVPAVDSVEAMLEGYTGKEAIAAGEAFNPSYDNIHQRTDTLTLDNGAEVALLPKKTRGEQVVLSLELQFGTEQSLRGKGNLGGMTGSLLMRGTERYSREQLQTELDKIKTSMSVSGSATGASAFVQTQREHLPRALSLLSEVLRRPAFSAKEFKLLKEEYLAGLESSRQNPQAIVSRQMERFYSPFDKSHPLYQPTVDEEVAALEALSLEAIDDFYRRFYGGNQMQIALVGDFEADAVAEQLNQLLGDWENDTPYERIAQPFVEFEPVDKRFSTPDKENAAVVALQEVPLGQSDEDSIALGLGSYIFGGGFLNSRLAERLRQEDGLSYGVGAWTATSPFESRGEFSAYAIFAPQNLEGVERGITEELQKVIADGFREDELQAAKSGIVQKSSVERSEDKSLANKLRSNLYLDRDMLWYKAREEKMQSLTPEDVHAVYKRHLDPSQLSFIKAGDFEKGEKVPAEDE